MSFLAFVRHGESTWNAEQRLQGQLDPPLSATGRAQAAALAGLVAGLQVPGDRVVCSDLLRARETAAGLGVTPASYDPRWREIGVGEWGGLVASEVDASVDGLTNWRGGPRTAPSGEPWPDFFARVGAACDALLAAGGPWLVITHGGCIRAVCAHITGGDALAFAAPPNASLTTVALTQRPQLAGFGVTAGGLRTGLY